MPNESMVVRDEVVDAELVMHRTPEAVLDEARSAAVALRNVISAKPRKVMFNGEQYLEVEDWLTCARFFSISVKVVETHYVEYGDVRGFSARAVALRSDGAEISAAEADCLTDEEKWRSKPKYEWRDGARGREKVKIADEPVPLFQLKSMAQTRACAKALRNVLAWVVVLAGYRATPAEELEVDRQTGEEKPKAAAAPPAAQSPASAMPASDGRPAGAVLVKSIEVKNGVNAKTQKPWTKYTVTFDDARAGATFDKAIADLAVECHEKGRFVQPTIVSETKGDRTNVNLIKLEVVVAAEPKLPIVQEDKEPVGQPEKILMTRAVVTAQGKHWVVQSNCRTYTTNQEPIAMYAEEARKAKVAVIIVFDAKPDAKGVVYNMVKSMEEVSATPSVLETELEEGPSEEVTA
jgi:hypothetical protein